MSANTNPPAFPRPFSKDGNSEAWSQDGMTLRQWYAGQALAGICANSIPGDHHIPSVTVRNAFELADAMLAHEQTEATRSAQIAVALHDLVAIIDKAGLLHLSNGVQLGATSWYCKASDCLEFARRVLPPAKESTSV